MATREEAELLQRGAQHAQSQHHHGPHNDQLEDASQDYEESESLSHQKQLQLLMTTEPDTWTIGVENDHSRHPPGPSAVSSEVDSHSSKAVKNIRHQEIKLLSSRQKEERLVDSDTFQSLLDQLGSENTTRVAELGRLTRENNLLRIELARFRAVERNRYTEEQSQQTGSAFGADTQQPTETARSVSSPLGARNASLALTPVPTVLSGAAPNNSTKSPRVSSSPEPSARPSTTAVSSASGPVSGVKRESLVSRISKRLIGADSKKAALQRGWSAASNLTIDYISEAGSSAGGPNRPSQTNAQNVTLAPDWEKFIPLPKKATVAAKRMRVQQSTMLPDSRLLFEEHHEVIQRFIASPGSFKRTLWDLCGAILIFYDLHYIPITVFDPPENAFTTFMDWISLLFWTANMFASVCVGYVQNGETIMDPIRICFYYLRTWFIIDVAMIIPDWTFVLLSIGHPEEADGRAGGAGNLVQLMRILRLIRMTRLVRLLKLRRAIDHINDMIDSEAVGIAFNIVKMIVLLLIINHLIGCCWFWLGTSSELVGSNSQTWVKAHDYEDAGWGYQYLTSVHWAITQFTPASMSVQAWNAWERAYAIVVVVFALVVFSYIVGSITGSLTQLRSMHQERYKEFWTLRRFLKMNGVQQELATRITKYLEYAWQTQRDNLSEKDVKVFKFLSEQLYSELQWEISSPVLYVHPLFSQLVKVVPVTMHRLANKAMTRNRLVEGDPLFLRGERATNLYFLRKGSLVYNLTDGPNGHYSEQGITILQEGQAWVSEPALWVSEWIHIGSLTAATESETLNINPAKFKEVMAASPAAYNMAQEFAKNFVEWINSEPFVTDLTNVEMGTPHLFYSFLPP